MNKIKNALLSGIVALLPIFLTVIVVVRTFNVIDSWLQGFIVEYFGREIVGLGFIVVVLLVVVIGLLTNTFFARKLTSAIDWIFARIPFIKSVYTTIRGLVSLSKPNEKSFKKVVMVKFPNEDTNSIGFITKEDIDFSEDSLVSVFIPTTPNPTNGFLIYVKPEMVTVLNMTVEEGLKSVISLGSLTPNELKEKK